MRSVGIVISSFEIESAKIGYFALLNYVTVSFEAEHD